MNNLKTKKMENARMIMDMALVADGREPLSAAESDTLIKSYIRRVKIAVLGLIAIDFIVTLVVGGAIGLVFGLNPLYVGISLFAVRKMINFDLSPFTKVAEQYFALRAMMTARNQAKKVGAPYVGFGGGDREINPLDLNKILNASTDKN